MKRLHEVIDTKRFGNKTARLAKLLSAGFPVKDGVAIDFAEVEEIRRSCQIPHETIDEITPMMQSGKGVAVRSSAIGEDDTLSWAGQFKTILFVKSVDFGKAILECADAKGSEAVIAYARTHKIEVPNLALLVQEMVDAEVSGVLFTINPVTGANEMVIEVISGVSMALVDGSNCPTARYYVNPIDSRVLKKEGDEQKEPLSTAQIGRLIFFGKSIQEFFGNPQDIEWAIERGTGKIFINQSRDITTLDNQSAEVIRKRTISEIGSSHEKEMHRLQTCGLAIESENFLSDQNIAELLTPHPCQMAFGLFAYEFAHGDGAIRTARNKLGYEIGPELETGFFWLVGGQPRCSIIHDALTYRIKGIPLLSYGRLVDYYLARINEESRLANYPEVVLYNQNPSFDFLAEIFSKTKAREYRAAYEEFFGGIRVLEDKLSTVCQDEFFPRWNKKIALYRAVKPEQEVAVLSSRFRELCDLLRTEACIMFVKVARLGFFAYARLRQLLVELFGPQGESYINTLTADVHPDIDINVLFNLQLAGLNYGDVPLETVVKSFGHLAEHELEISFPRYHEKPEIFQRLATKISRKELLQDFETTQQRSSELRKKLVSSAGSRKDELEREITMAGTYLPLRELVKFHFLMAYNLLREVALMIEKKLGWEEDLIFHLDPQEVFNIADRKDELFVTAEQRYTAFRENKVLYVPPVMSAGHFEEIGYLKAGGSKILRGIGVTNFVTEGKVVVVNSLDNKDTITKLHRGAILVAVTTDPAWTPFLSVVGREGGLVTEIGGLLAHGAIYAREVGMAAVLNVPNATNILKTGMHIRVNGPAGYVEILDD